MKTLIFSCLVLGAVSYLVVTQSPTVNAWVTKQNMNAVSVDAILKDRFQELYEKQRLGEQLVVRLETSVEGLKKELAELKQSMTGRESALGHSDDITPLTYPRHDEELQEDQNKGGNEDDKSTELVSIKTKGETQTDDGLSEQYQPERPIAVVDGLETTLLSHKERGKLLMGLVYRMELKSAGQ